LQRLFLRYPEAEVPVRVSCSSTPDNAADPALRNPRLR